MSRRDSASKLTFALLRLSAFFVLEICHRLRKATSGNTVGELLAIGDSVEDGWKGLYSVIIGESVSTCWLLGDVVKLCCQGGDEGRLGRFVAHQKGKGRFQNIVSTRQPKGRKACHG